MNAKEARVILRHTNPVPLEKLPIVGEAKGYIDCYEQVKPLVEALGGEKIMNLINIVDKFLLGFFGGLGWLIVSLLWHLIVKR